MDKPCLKQPFQKCIVDTSWRGGRTSVVDTGIFGKPEITTMRFILLLASLLQLTLQAKVGRMTILSYIDRYSDEAVSQMTRYGIPASVILAQAIHESAAGTSLLATRSNNHFGIKCHKEWVGDTVVKTDDTLNECFRMYKSVFDSYEDHSLFLKTRPRYAFLFKFSDYRSWCFGLKEAGYATHPKYAFDLVRIIEEYELYRFDNYQYMVARVSNGSPEPQLQKPRINTASFTLWEFCKQSLLHLSEETMVQRTKTVYLARTAEPVYRQ